jgi:AraC-like DNA-binding protein
MRIATFRPSAALAPFVDKLAIVESDIDVTRALLPELGLILGIRFAGAAHLGTTRLPDATLTGVQGTVRQISTAAGGGIVLATFKPGGAAACFREPLHELFGTLAPLDALLPRDELERVRDRIATAPSHAHRAALLDELLVARICSPPDRIVMLAARAIDAAGGRIRIADLARDLGVSQDPLEKRFRRAVGASPKQLAMLVRIRRAIALAAVAPRSLANVALAAGYFDQSHFNREFRAVTGEPPTTFFRDTAYC